MPRLDLSAWLIWLTIQLAQWGLVLYFVRSGLWRRRPAIASFLVLRVITSSVLLFTVLFAGESAPPIYYWSYWSAAAIGVFLRIWIIAELASRACAGTRTQRGARWTVALMALVLCGVSAVASAHTPLLYGDWIMRLVVTLVRTVSLTWIACFVIAGLAGELFGLVRDRRETLLAAGLSLQAGGELAVSWVLGFTSSVALVSDTQDMLYLFSLGLWAQAICRSRLVPSPETLNPRQLKSIAVPLFHAGQRFIKK